jgi:F-type H+-transporting ATPase subunit c
MTDSAAAIGAGLAALGMLGPALGVGLSAFKTLEGMSRQPELADKLFINGVVFAAFCEGLGLIAALIGFKLAGFF